MSITVANDREPAGEHSDCGLQSVNPATGEVVGTYPIHDEQAVAAAVERARSAARWWEEIGFAGRAKRLLEWKGVLARRIRQLAQLIHVETGKPTDDALIEVMTAIAHLDWAAKKARKVLAPRRVWPGLPALNFAAIVEYQPLGVIGVIGPWNYPLFTPLGSIAYALAAGNAVVYKPSEYVPGVGTWLAESFGDIVPEQPVLQTVTGFGETGAALVRAGVDKIAFTGSTATAKKVMAACAERLIPIVAECGGKDAFIVDLDADLDAAVDAALWGAMSHAGQTCVGVERIFVVEGVYDEFLRRLTEVAATLRAGDDREADYGPITMPSQLDVIERHIDEALERGGRAVVGGRDSVRTPYVDPVVLVDVPEDCPANTEETFGPTVTVTRVADLDEAVRRANASSYGLGATIFAKSRRRAIRTARLLRSGMTAINAVVAFAGIPALPFGGMGASGFGRLHGPDGLREFARAKAIARQRFPLRQTNVTSFRRRPADLERLVAVVQLVHGRQSRDRVPGGR